MSVQLSFSGKKIVLACFAHSNLSIFFQSIGRDIANSALQGMSCGTFLYIALLEVLFPELSNPQYRMPKILTMLLGFIMICVLLMFTH